MPILISCLKGGWAPRGLARLQGRALFTGLGQRICFRFTLFLVIRVAAKLEIATDVNRKEKIR